MLQVKSPGIIITKQDACRSEEEAGRLAESGGRQGVGEGSGSRKPWLPEVRGDAEGGSEASAARQGGAWKPEGIRRRLASRRGKTSEESGAGFKEAQVPRAAQ